MPLEIFNSGIYYEILEIFYAISLQNLIYQTPKWKIKFHSGFDIKEEDPFFMYLYIEFSNPFPQSSRFRIFYCKKKKIKYVLRFFWIDFFFYLLYSPIRVLRHIVNVKKMWCMHYYKFWIYYKCIHMNWKEICFKHIGIFRSHKKN